jgi:hypothetical protein
MVNFVVRNVLKTLLHEISRSEAAGHGKFSRFSEFGACQLGRRTMALIETSVEPRGSSLALLGARAVFNNGRSSVECQVRNFSITGARLAISSTVSLPDEFLLEIPGRQKAYRAGLRWKSRDAAGVRFLSEMSIDADVATANEDAAVDQLQMEIERLRSENQELKEKLAALGFPSVYPN